MNLIWWINTKAESYLQAAMNIQHEVMKMNTSFSPAAGPKDIEVVYQETNQWNNPDNNDV